MPPEFEKFKFKPENWSPVDCIALLKLYAFQNCISYNSELIFGDIAEALGSQRALELIPNYPKDAPYSMDSLPHFKLADSRKQKDSTQINPDSLKSVAPVLSSLLKIKENIGVKNSVFGTNVWAYSNQYGDKKSSILACDPHFTLSLPALWHQSKLTAGGINVFGATLPGIPAYFLGRNSKIAWGLASLNIDDFDFYIEKTDASNQDYYYKASGEKVKFKLTRDTIKVKDGESVVFDIRRTPKSGIISDATFMDECLNQNPKDLSVSYNRKFALSFEWTASAVSDEISSLLKIAKSDDWEEFKSSLNNWGAPAVNFAYADVKGNIGLKPSGYYPKRGARSSFIPYPSWQTNAYWDSIQKFDNTIKLYNPPKRFVCSANNGIAPGLSIPALYAAPWRAYRIEELLSSVDYLTSRDAQLMQNDSYSKIAKDICGITLPILWKAQNYLPNNEKEALCYFNVWDYAFNSQSIGAAIFRTYYERLAFNIFEDNLGLDVYKKYRSQDYAFSQKLYEVLTKNNEYWIDDYRTPQKEKLEDIVKRSFSEAINELKQKINDKMWTWKYSDINKVDIKSFLSFDGIMNSSIERNNISCSGSPWSINLSEGLGAEKNSAAMRFVADLNDSLVYSIVPGGISAQPLNENYTDQIALYFGGGYIPVSIKGQTSDKTTLKVIIRN